MFDVFVKQISLLPHRPLLLVLLRLGQLALLNSTVRDGVITLQLREHLSKNLLLGLKDLARMVLSVHSALQVEAFSLSAILRLLEPGQHTLEVILHNLDPVTLVLVASLIALNFVLGVFDPRL